MDGITSIESLPSTPTLPSDPPSLSTQILKLDRLLRLFKTIKTYDTNTANEVRTRAKAIMKEMQKIDAGRYEAIEEKVNGFVNAALMEPVVRKVQGKVQGRNSEGSVSARGGEKIQSFGSFTEKKVAEVQSSSLIKSSENIKPESKDKQQSKQKEPDKAQKQRELQKQKQRQLQKQRERDRQLQREHQREKAFQNYNIDFNKKQSSTEFSGSLSGPFKSNLNLKQYCQINGSTIESKLVINEEVLTYLKTMNADKVALLGVQKPQDKNTDKLYLCSYMEFAREIVVSMKFKAKDYQNQLDQFVNVIRFPLALCVIGQTVTDMKVHYVKFLLEMTSPLPLVIIFNQVAPDKSLLIRMSQKVVNTVDNSNIIQIDSLDSTINMKDRNKYKCINLKDVPVVRDRCVTTKPLYRKLNQEIIENNQAILVERSGKEGRGEGKGEAKGEAKAEIKVEAKTEIKVEKVQQAPQKIIEKDQKIEQPKTGQPESPATNPTPNQFPYTFHSKFHSTVLNENFVYFIQQNNEINCRKKTKTIEQSLQFIKSSNSRCILGYWSRFIEKRIPPELFVSVLGFGAKCPIVMIRIKSLTLNKVALVSVVPGTTEEVLNDTVVLYKDLEERKFPFLNILLIGQKTQISKYENAKSMLIQI